MKLRLRTTGLLFALALLLSGCVTSTESPYGEKADREKALKLSTQLARTYIREGEWEAAKRHLKYAIETDPRNPHYVETVYGVGYRFRGE